MFETGTPISCAEVSALLDRIGAIDPLPEDSERIDLIGRLEALKGAAAAAQAELTADLWTSQRSDEQPRGIREAQTSRSVGAQVALARREGPVRGSRFLGFAQALTQDMPHTFTALRRGEISEWRATLVVQETACTTVAVRRLADAELADQLDGVSDRRAAAMTAAIVAREDAAAVVARNARAVASRRVTLRPAPDGMAILRAVLPCAGAVASLVALRRAADSAAGDRPRGQVMVDLLVERLTGRDPAVGPDVEIQLVMSEASLVRGGGEPARLAGYGPIPAQLARKLARGGHTDTTDRPPPPSAPCVGHDRGARDAVNDGGSVGDGGPDPSGEGFREARVFLRRLFATPGDSGLVRMESSRRFFPPGLRRLVVARDDTCRTPYCEAPIRHIDHVSPAARGGPTSYDNGQGLCEHCNYVKQHPDWTTE